MSLKYVAIDVYGTIISSDDPENAMPPRPGTLELFEACKERKINIITVSDCPTSLLECELEESRVPRGYIAGHMHMQKKPKEFDEFLRKFNVTAEEVTVIGDNLEFDILAAYAVGIRAYIVPEYNYHDNFDLRTLIPIIIR
jgi:FMN phosphatase YigB (HAD superfamily)